MRLIVVGAGVAGLTAADAARCAGAEVVVVEARDRVGGRTWTVPFGPGSVDLGAFWVHGPLGNPVAEAIRAAGLETRNDGAYCARMAVWADGWVGAADATAVAAAFEADWDPSQALAAAAGSDRYTDGVEWFLADRGLDGRARELAGFALQWMGGALVVGGPPDRISLAGAAAYEDGGGGNLVVAGGYRALVERLAEGLELRLASPVGRVEHGPGGVSVQTPGETVEGDAAVVTVPLGVLQAEGIAFDPPLGPELEGAVERLAMGTAEKLVLRFAERFWPDEVRHVTRVAADRSFAFWDDVSEHVGSPALIAFHNPSVTPALAGLSAPERLEAGLGALREMFGDVPDPEQAVATEWTQDPWSRGSYSYVPLGASPADMGRLAEPVSGRLALAGEATVPRWYGTVHAAFASGLRAAGQVLGRRPERLSLGAVPQHWLA